MTLTDVAPPTIPARTKTPQIHVGDVLVIGRTRWKVRAMNRTTGQVALSSMNLANADIWWTTTLDKLPTKDTK